MQTACHRCGAMLDEGTAFCPSCGAPQIRVNPTSADSAATPPLLPGTPGNMQPAAIPMAAGAARVDWSVAVKAAALMGLLAGVPSAVRLTSAGCCLWIVAGGALAVMMYQRSKPGGLVTAGMGARIGAVAGFFAFVFWFLFQLVGPGMAEFRLRLMERMHEAATSNPDPKAQQAIQEFISTPGAPAIVLAVFIGIYFLAFVIFGLIGGAVGASVWGRKQSS